MSKNNLRLPLVCSIAFINLTAFTTATALTPEQYQEQRSEALKQQQIPTPTVNIDTTPFQTEIAKPDITTTADTPLIQPPAPSPCFDINHIYLNGDMAAQFGFAITPYTTGSGALLGQCMDVDAINTLAKSVQNRIIEKGYVTTRVLIQNQNLKSGNLVLSVIPGRIDQIVATDIQANRPVYTDGFGNPANFAPAMPMKSGDLLNVRQIEQALENFKRVPTADADFSIAPSDRLGKPGYSVVVKFF